MRNVIKKILLESEDDFEWIRDVTPYGNSYTELGFTPSIGEKVICLPGFNRNMTDRRNYGGSAYREGEVYTVRGVNKPEWINKGNVVWVEEHHNGIYLNALAPYEGTINESEEDFDWIRDTVDPLQPGNVYRTPNGNTLKIISVREKHVDYDLYDTERSKMKSIIILKSTLLDWINDGRWVKVDKMVNESEEDFDWIRDISSTDHMNHKYTMNEMVDFLEKQFKMSDGMYRINTNYVGGDVTSFEIVDSNNAEYDRFYADEFNDDISLNDVIDRLLGNIDNWNVEEHVRGEYRDLATFIKNTIINESEEDDFQWIRDVTPHTRFSDLDRGDSFVVDEITKYGEAMLEEFTNGLTNDIIDTVFEFDGQLDIDERHSLMKQVDIINEYGYDEFDEVENILLHRDEPDEVDIYVWVDEDMIKIRKV